MKQTVKLSTFSITLSALSLIVLLVSAYYCRDNWGLYLIGALIIALMMLTLFYMPMSITCSADELLIQRSLRIKSIPLSDIQSVKLCPPTMAEHRLCGSGGWFGYWGWFSEPSIGKYFAYVVLGLRYYYRFVFFSRHTSISTPAQSCQNRLAAPLAPAVPQSAAWRKQTARPSVPART